MSLNPAVVRILRAAKWLVDRGAHYQTSGAGEDRFYLVELVAVDDLRNAVRAYEEGGQYE